MTHAAEENESGTEPEEYYYWQAWMVAKELGYKKDFQHFVTHFNKLIQEQDHENR
jgi:hypothetical protein